MRSSVALAIVLGILFAGSTSLAQVHPVETVYVISGIERHETVGSQLVVPKNSVPVVRPVGLLRVDSPASHIIVDAEDQQRNTVPVEQVDVDTFFIFGLGKVWIDVICVDFKQENVARTKKVITIEDGQPTPVDPDDTVDPVDPSPVDPDEPDEDDPPAPMPGDGLQVLIVYEIDQLPTLAPEQHQQLYSKSLRVWLHNNCMRDDGLPQFRVFDQHTVGQDNLWQRTLDRPRTSLPWIVVSNGRTGYEGPLPATEAATIQLLERYK